MREPFDELIKTEIQAEAGSIGFSDEQNTRILENIHRESKRRKNRMTGKGRKILLAAAAIAVLGTMTVIGAGKVVGYYSSINRNQVDYANARELKGAAAELGAVPKAPQQFTNGLSFESGYLYDLQGMDESGTPIETYKQVAINYGEQINLSLHAVREENGDYGTPVKTGEVSGVALYAHEDNYLFLPPDSEPSAADLALEAEGKLFISYGSDKEERQTFRYVRWTDDGLSYLLSTFNESYHADQLLQMAAEVIAAE